jgi:hypothetical protein
MGGNMKSYSTLIKDYVKFYIMNLGLLYLSQELWNWFEGDSLLKMAAIGTISFIVVDLIKLFNRKYRANKYESILYSIMQCLKMK